MGRGGEKAVTDTNNTSEKAEVLLDGTLYDVSNMKHPGGSVIKFYSGNGIDATQAFNNFHLRSKKATAMLKALPSRPAPKTKEAERVKGQNALLDDFNQLQEELKAEGFFEPAPLHVFYRVMELVVMHVIGAHLLLNHADSYLLMTGGLLLLGLASGRCGWLMHEGGHYSLTGHIPTDKMLQVIIYGVGCGMSGGWWRNQHNKHHSMPQKIGHDVDLNTLPLVAFTSKVVKRIGIPMKLWLRLQAPMFPTVTCQLVALGWQFYLHPRHVLRTKNAYEAMALCVRYAAWTYFITMRFGFVNSALLYLAYNWFASTYIFVNFAVSHTHLPVVPKDDVDVDWVRYAAIHTMNVSAGPFKFVDWWMSFLNYQIEHHLFPAMPQFRHPETSLRVQKLFAKHGLKYDQRSYVDSLKVTFENLHNVGMDVFYG